MNNGFNFHFSKTKFSFKISDTTSGVEVKVVVKQGGYLIGGNDTDIEFFGSAPFRPEINTF